MEKLDLQNSSCIRTFTGKYMNVFEPTLDMIDIEDIAHALSHACRWAGHVPRFYSVAEHSIHCANLIVDKSQAFEALMHDASEAYLVDVPRPIKHRLLEYKAIEDNLMRLIAEKFGFKYPMSEEVKNIDNQLLQMEWDGLILGNVDHKELLSLPPVEAKALTAQQFYYQSDAYEDDTLWCPEYCDAILPNEYPPNRFKCDIYGQQSVDLTNAGPIIQEQLKWSKEKYAKEISAFVKAFCEDKVKVCWGVVTFYS